MLKLTDFQLIWNSADWTIQNFERLINYSFIPRIQEIEDDFKSGRSTEVSCLFKFWINDTVLQLNLTLSFDLSSDKITRSNNWYHLTKSRCVWLDQITCPIKKQKGLGPDYISIFLPWKVIQNFEGEEGALKVFKKIPYSKITPAHFL